MDCDDVMLAIANRDQRTLTGAEKTAYHSHLEDCEECRALAVDTTTDWRWIARLPEDAFEDPNLLVLPTVDPIVFEIDMEIAAGGMGRITKAMDRRLGREVALKEVLEPGMRARFEREALITARLQHPAIVPIYEAGTFPNGSAFYTMRLVWGGTLGAAIHKTKSMTERLALLPHVLAVIDALAYAHANKIIHRDLKPGNVLVGEFGETVVIDWGLAKELDRAIEPAAEPGAPSRPSNPNLTRVGSVLGTPGFMSPEQASGGSIDERADVYALGAILYNLLAGVPPYWDKHGEAGSTQIIAVGLKSPPTPLGELAPEAPADLRAIVEKAMARSKTDRYRSAQEMAGELRRFAAGQLIAREYTLRELVWRWIRKHRAPVISGALAAVALAIIAVVAFVNVTRSRSAEIAAREEAEKSEHSAKTDRDEAQNKLAALLEEQGVRELLLGDSSRALTYLAAAFEKRDSTALRYLIAAASHDLEQPQTLHAAKAIGFLSGRAGDMVATIEANQITLWHGGSTAGPPHDLGVAQVAGARFDPSGSTVAIERVAGTARPLELWDVVAGIKRWTIDEGQLDGAHAVFAPDGNRLVAYAGKKLAVRDVSSAPQPLVVLDARSPIVDLAFGKTYLAACGQDGSVSVWGVGELAKPGAAPVVLPADCTRLAFLEANQLAIATTKFELVRWTIGESRADRTMSGHIAINVIAVNEKTRRIATGDATGIVMWTWNGDALGESRDVQGGITRLAFSPDGSVVAGSGADDRVLVWDSESFHLRQTFTGGRSAIDGLAIDPTGTRIAAAGSAGSYIWRTPTGRQKARVDSLGSTIAGDYWIAADRARISVRSLESGGEVRSIPHLLRLRELVASRDGTLVVAHDGAGTLGSFDATRETPIAMRSTHPSARPPILTSDPRRLLELDARRALITDATTGKLVQELALDDAPIAGDISADGERVAVSFATRIGVWDAITGKPVQGVDALPAGNYQVRFDPAGARLVVFGGPERAIVIDRAGARTSLATGACSGVAFSRNRPRLAFGIGNTVELWDPQNTAKPLFVVSSTIKGAYAIADDGELFATGSVDGSIRIWDDTGRLLDRLIGSQTGITRLEFGESDTRLIGQSDDHHTTLWDVHVERGTPADVKSFVDQHSNWRLDGVQLVPSR